MAGPGSYLIGAEEEKELLDVIRSGHLFRYGAETDPRFQHKVINFETEFAAQLGAKHVLATSSGTAALLCCLAALGIGAGDEVIVPGYTFIATISSVITMHAVPVLAEIDESLTLDPARLEALITPRTRAIIPVHMLGNPCDMDAILPIARKHGLYVIEDCCQAVGASYKGKRCGNWGDIGAYSMNFFKNITTGDGGAVATNDDLLYERAFGFHDQGHKPLRMGTEVGERSIVGINLKMNELTGAVALAQQRKLEFILTTLRRKKALLKDILTDLPGVTFRTVNDPGECGTLLTLLFDTEELADRFCAAAGTRQIAYSGWHVYNNMEQILNKLTPAQSGCPYACPRYPGVMEYKKHMLPRTDAILNRAVNLSVGVVDAGLGAACGVNILSTEAEIQAEGERLAAIIKAL